MTKKVGRSLRRKLEIGLWRYYRSGWVRREHASEAAPIIVGGCDRSGTTLLRAAIDSHPLIAAGPESWVFVYRREPGWLASEYGFEEAFVRELMDTSPSLAAFADDFFEAYRKRCGAAVWCEKSPRNVLRFPWILERFPKARIVHIIRDGRDVACSLRHHPKRIRVGDRYVPSNINRPIRSCIDHWTKYVRAGLAHRGDERYTEVRYEDLVSDYEGTMRRLCEHCRVEWSDEVLRREEIQSKRSDMEIVNPEVRTPLYHSSLGRWRRDLSEEEQALVMKRAGGLLGTLGYLNDHDAADAGVRGEEHAA